MEGTTPEQEEEAIDNLERDTLIAVLGEATRVLEKAKIPHMVIGSIAAAVHGGTNWPRDDTDIDFFLREVDAYRAQSALADAGFRPETPPGKEWLVKAWKDDVLVDLIYRAARVLEPDDEMLARAAYHRVGGHDVVVIAPEDYVVMQASTHSIQTKEHWFNALDVLTRRELDWDYFIERARAMPHRTLSLLYYARADGIEVPDAAIARIAESSQEVLA